MRMSLIAHEKYIQQLSIDCVIFGYQQRSVKVLITKLNLTKNIWALPGGFIFQDEGIDTAASRILFERTGLKSIFLEQFNVFGNQNRINHDLIKYRPDPSVLNSGLQFSPSDLEWLSKRFVSIGYYALVDINKVTPRLSEFDESIEWLDVQKLPHMIMDHNEIVLCALVALRQNLDNKLIGFNLLPETFTMREVQELYEAIYDKPFPRNNFQKKMLDLNVLERLEKKFTGAANKAPYLYRFKSAG